MNDPIFLRVKDHSFSKEEFELLHDAELDLVYTYPQPEESILPSYYESDDYISHTDGKRSVFEKIYHVVKSIALSNKVNLIDSLQPQKGKLLDIGAGTGDFINAAYSRGWDVTGVEPNEKAKKIASQKKILYAESTNELHDHTFDVITMWHVLEHVPDVDLQIKELKRLLKPNGIIFIAVPNFRSYDANYYGIFWAAFDVPRHLWHFSKTSIEILFGREALHVYSVVPMRFDAFYVALLSEKYKTGNMNYLKAFYIGLKSNLKARSNFEYSSLIYVIKN